MQVRLHMVQRRFWQNLLEDAWKQRTVLWLSGVRRVGKTYLCQSLPSTEYFDCELPRTRRAMKDPQGFLDGMRGKRIILDEIHRLSNPSQLLKIAADHYRDIQVIAAGSSTLGASRKFRDTLTGRKRDLWLTPMCLADLDDAKITNIEERLKRGGLPPFLLEKEVDERDFQDVRYYRGWQRLRKEDLGDMWEHFVLNEMMARMQSRDIHYWRDKRGHEVDFVLTERGENPTAIECKWSASGFDAANLVAFRKQHPQGKNVVLASDVTTTYRQDFGAIKVKFEGLETFAKRLKGP